MSARATWKGVLKISLVNIPIKVYPATESREALAFHQLHGECQARIHQRKWCATCGREVTSAEIVKGFEFEKGRYVILQPEEFDAVQPPSSRVIDLVQFADVGELDPLFLDRAYYLVPDGTLAGAAYAVVRDAMAGFVGIGKLAIYGREYLVAVRPQHGRLMLLYTLHHVAEIRSADAIEELAAVPARAPLADSKLARSVIDAFTGPLDLADFTDEYQADLRRLIDAKVAGEEIVVPPADPAIPVVDLQAALTQSLLAVSAAKKRTAAAAPRRKGA